MTTLLFSHPLLLLKFLLKKAVTFALRRPFATMTDIYASRGRLRLPLMRMFRRRIDRGRPVLGNPSKLLLLVEAEAVVAIVLDCLGLVHNNSVACHWLRYVVISDHRVDRLLIKGPTPSADPLR